MKTQERIEQIEKAIEELYSLDNIEKANLYVDNVSWNYYYSFSGWLNGVYFAVNIRLLDGYKETIEISDVTDCKEKITELINKLLNE